MSFQATSAREYAQHRKLLMHAASAPMAGRHRERVEGVLASIMDEPAFCVSYDKALAVITGLGAEFEPSAKDDEVVIDADGGETMRVSYDDSRVFRRGFMDSKLRSQLPGAAFANKNVFGWTIPCGVVLIVAGGGKGKTPLAHALAGAHGTDPDHRYAVVRVGEPLSGYSNHDAEAALDLGCAMASVSDVVLDSVKDLLSGGSGNAMKSGLSRGALTSISSWSTLAVDLGCTLYVPVNPSSDDDEVKQLLIESARSNATAVLFQTSGNTWEYSSRTGEGLERISGILDVTYSADNVLVKAIKHSDSAPRRESDEQFGMRFRATLEDYSAATSRALSKRTEF